MPGLAFKSIRNARNFPNNCISELYSTGACVKTKMCDSPGKDRGLEIAHKLGVGTKERVHVRKQPTYADFVTGLR